MQHVHNDEYGMRIMPMGKDKSESEGFEMKAIKINRTGKKDALVGTWMLSVPAKEAVRLKVVKSEPFEFKGEELASGEIQMTYTSQRKLPIGAVASVEVHPEAQAV